LLIVEVELFWVDLIVLNQLVLVVISFLLLVLMVVVQTGLLIVVEYKKNVVEQQMVLVDDRLLLNKQYTIENHDFLVNVKVNVHFLFEIYVVPHKPDVVELMDVSFSLLKLVLWP
jgi:hypothetical protein